VKTGLKATTAWGWVAILGSLAITIVLTKAADLLPLWRTFCLYTVVVFASVTVALRPAWGRRNFWWALVISFLVHTLAIFFAIREFPASSREFHGVPLIVSAMIESLLISGFLWRASMKKISQRPS
jgi:hypothetical protein